MNKRILSFLLTSFLVLSSCTQEETIVDTPSIEPETVDLTMLPLGDGKISSEPKVGYIYSCDTRLDGGGAFNAGEWINEENGTWDATKKVIVDGDVEWPNASFTIEVEGDKRVLTGNGLPIDHNTGTYPIARTDDAYKYDRNPNSIESQTLRFELPINPTFAESPNCASGTVAISLNGILIFNGFDAGGRDAVAHEIQDQCDGHPQRTGQYHYHNLSRCFEDSESGHSALVGYAFDGFGLYGSHGENGETLTNEDLDACHGHSHEIEWEGETVEMYHYHATNEFPYTVGCFMGESQLTRLERP